MSGLKIWMLALSCVCVASAAWAQAEPEVDPAVAGPPIKKGTRLQGTTFISRNRKVTGASVLVRAQNDPTRLFVTATDERGGFRIDDLPDGRYRVEVQREGLAREVKEDIALRFPFRSVVDLPMEPAGPERPDTHVPEGGPVSGKTVAVHGRVLARGGSPLAETQLRLVRWDARADPVQLRADSDGTFRIAQLLAGHWRLEARGAGYLPIRIGLPIEDDLELVISMVTQPADHDPSPLELMPVEEPIAPPDIPEVLVVK